MTRTLQAPSIGACSRFSLPSVVWTWLDERWSLLMTGDNEVSGCGNTITCLPVSVTL